MISVIFLQHTKFYFRVCPFMIEWAIIYKCVALFDLKLLEIENFGIFMIIDQIINPFELKFIDGEIGSWKLIKIFYKNCDFKNLCM